MTIASARSRALLQRIQGGETLICDGATGTCLHRQGLDPGACPEIMNATHPDVVRGVAADYFAAGSDLVLTNSFGGNRLVLKKYGLEDRVQELNRLAAEHARAAAADGRYVVATTGATGEFLQPLGPISEAEMYDAFAEQVKAFEEGGADAVIFETMSALEEITLGIKAAKENTGLPVFGSMVLNKGPTGFFTMMGVTPEQVVQGLKAAGADVVGSNCGNGSDLMIEVGTELRKLTNEPLIIEANAGSPTLVGGETVFPETPEYMAERFKKMADLGINILGGCCGTTPDHIRAIASAIRGS